MDHREIEERQIVHLYLQGKLSSEEEERFEEHYLDCRECLAQLQAAESLHRGLKGLAAREAARQAVARAGLLAGASRLLRSRGFWLGAALVLMALLPTVTLWHQVSELETALQQARADDPGASPDLRGEVADLQRELEAARRDHARELEAARQARQELEERLRRSLLPRAGTLIAYLSPLRSAGGEEPPVPRVHLDADVPEVVLALDLGAAPGARHQVTLHQAGEPAPRWRSGPLAAGADGELTLSLPTPFLTPGDYRLDVESLEGGATPARTAVFPFQVVAARPPG
jgi:multidrug efflux pump subunit AcrA (membrane-fusion protein)